MKSSIIERYIKKIIYFRKLIFQYLLEKKKSNGSFGIEVASLSALPISIIERAKFIFEMNKKKNANQVEHGIYFQLLPKLESLITKNKIVE